MVVGAKVRKLTEGLLWFVCGLYVGILTSSLTYTVIPLPYRGRFLGLRAQREIKLSVGGQKLRI